METLQRTANRGRVSTGYDVDNSVVFEDANSESLHKSLSSQSRDCFTISFWLKRTALGAQRLVGAGASGNNEVIIHFTSSDELEFYSWEGAYAMRYKTNRVFRDTNAFYHFAFLVDTRLSTASERTQIYVNGVLETSFSVSVVPGQNSLFDWTTNIYVGKGGAAADADMSGYLSEFVYLDDTKAAHTDLGEFDSDTGIWIPIDVSGLTFGTNGAYLDFEDSSNLGNDANGGTDFTATNITSADQATDTPTNNFCTGNNLVRFTNPSSQIVTEGGTLMTKGANGWETISGTIYVTKGKWYCEVQSILNSATTAYCSVMPDDSPIISAGGAISNFPGSQSGDGGVSYYANNGNKYLDGGNSSYGNDWKSGTGLGDIMGIALDMDNGKVYFAKANVWQNSGDPTSGATGTGAIDLPSPTKAYTMAAAIYANNNAIAINYGGYTYITISSGASDSNGHGTFEYAPPSGYFALCTKNLAETG